MYGFFLVQDLINYKNKIRHIVFVLVCFLFCFKNVYAQFSTDLYYSKKFTVNDGLSNSTINDLVQDEYGFLWIATQDGLNRFDGYSFKIFRADEDNPNSLPSSQIYKIFPDGHHHLWLGTKAGFSIFDCIKGEILKDVKIHFNPKLFLIHEKKLWIVSDENQLLLWDEQKNVLKKKIHLPKLQADEKIIFGTSVNEKNILLCSSVGTLYYYNSKTEKWKKNINNLAANNLVFDYASMDIEGNIYLATSGSELVYYNLLRNSYEVISATKKFINLIGINGLKYDNYTKVLWISTFGQGLFVYDAQNNDLTNLKNENNNSVLISNYIQAITKDLNNVLWIGYEGAGIQVLEPNIKKFSSLVLYDHDKLTGLAGIQDVCQFDNDRIWFATSGNGLVLYNKAKKTTRIFNVDNLPNLPDNFIRTIIKVKTQLWIGTHGGGLVVMDANNFKIIKKFDDINHPLFQEVIWSLFYDAFKNKVFVGTKSGTLLAIDVRDFTYTIIENNLQAGINCMLEMDNHTFLIGTDNGLYHYKNQGSIIKVFPLQKDIKRGINAIYYDAKKRIWLGTEGYGLIILNDQFQKIRVVNTKNNLNNNVIQGILPASNYSLWVSTNKGLSNVLYNEYAFRENTSFQILNYDIKNGLQGNEFNSGACENLLNGEMVFAGAEGVNIFWPNKIQANKLVPKVLLTDFVVNNSQSNYASSISYLNKINLKYSENSFSIVYNTLGFTIPEKVNYKYQLVGYDKNWISAGNRTYVSYTNLNSGTYEFRVSASNYDGYWNSEYTSFKIHIATPIYKTWWFILAAMLLFAAIIYSIFRFNISRIKQKEELKSKYAREIAELEMKALRAQINPHFLFNSLNSINNFILKNDNINARKYLMKFSQLVRNILTHSSSPYINLHEELKTIELYTEIEGMRFDNTFRFYLELDAEINATQIKVPSLLLQPYVENAIWHGLLPKVGEKSLGIKVSLLSPNQFQIQIIDNGIGREEAKKYNRKKKKHNSMGMDLGEARIELMKNETGTQFGNVEVQDVLDEKNQVSGTRIILNLPLISYSIENNEK